MILTRPLTKYRAALAAIPAPGGNGCHVALLGVANLGVLAGLDDGQVTADIRDNIPRGTRPVPAREIQDAIATARRSAGTGQRTGGTGKRPRHPAPDPRPQVDVAGYMQKLLDRSAGAGEADLWEASPVRLNWVSGSADTVAVLESLYAPADILFCGTKYSSGAGCVAPVADWLAMTHKTGTVPWPHIIPNPMTGQQHLTEAGKLSYRCDNSVAAFKYATVEFDRQPEALFTNDQRTALAVWLAADPKRKKLQWPDWPAWPMEQQVAFWHSVIRVVPVALVTTSGGKSIHGWIATGCQNREQWETKIKHDLFDQWLVPLGADGACRNPSRLSRLAGHVREGKGLQRLLYLNPHGEVVR